MVDAMTSLRTVPAFYRDREIFVTGATGYLGKVLVEKLLRSCPDIGRIFVLVRPKRGQVPAERLKAFLEDDVFKRLRKENAAQLQKLVVISGDVRELGLSISAVDIERLRDVSVIIHSAATVRFDEPLKESILMNTRGTREVLRLGQSLPKLELFNHISTTFCNPEYSHTDEQLYPIPVNWRDAIAIAESIDSSALDVLTLKYTDFHPNTYTFSKRLSEHLVNDFQSECKFKIYIVRPSVVSPTIREPFPGWVDNFNGPLGLIIAACTGLYRFSYSKRLSVLDYQPCDIVCNSIIVTTWKQGQTTDKALDQEVPIYNSASSGKYSVTFKDLQDNVEGFRYQLPLLQTLWYPSVTFTSCYFYYVLLNILFLAIPSNILDYCLDLFKFKTRFRVSRLIRKLFYVQESLSFFMGSSFTFSNDRCQALSKELTEEDAETFALTSDVSKSEYIHSCLINSRWYLLKEPMTNVHLAQQKMYVLCILHYALLVVIYAAIFYGIYAYVNASKYFANVFRH